MANYLFCDGHVEFLRASAIKARVEKGDNPALPAE
jgi:prepilin-type processing-associated H-X9-DG protein